MNARMNEWFLPMEPYEFQWEIYDNTVSHIRKTIEPGFVYASVSAGKTLMQAMIAKRGQEMAKNENKNQLKMLFLARTGELVEQNVEEMWGIKALCSTFSASVGVKKTALPVIVGSEGTVARALDKELKKFVPDVLFIDECHQVDYENDDCQYMKIINEFKSRNPKLRIIGYTGSPWRGTEPIKGKFWKHEIYRMDMWALVELGFVEKPIFGFGHDNVKYDLSSIQISDKDGTEDFTAEQLKEQQKIIMSDASVTQNIMLEVMALTANRNCVLITCAGQKHMNECASVLPPGSFAMIHDKTKYKERKIIKEGCNTGKIKYVLQIGCWTVGVNIPPIDTIVILRKIGSLTLLTQLIGRGIRKLKKFHKDLGMFKQDCLVLDYSDTMASIGQLFNDPILEAAQLEKSKRDNDQIKCRRCNTMNSQYARRCMGKDLAPELLTRLAPDPRGRIDLNTRLKLKQPDGRCGHFWSSKKCEKCGIENDIVARSCRHCDHILIDPNANLNKKHYTDADYKPVLGFDMTLTTNHQGLVITYILPDGEKAVEIFYPQSEKIVARRIFFAEFVAKHLHKAWHHKVQGKSAMQILGLRSLFDIPKQITHRINDKGRSIIHRKVFNSGREETADE